MVVEVEHLDAAGAHALEPLGDEIDADHALAAMLGDPGGHIPDRTEAEHDQRPTIGHVGVLNALPGGRQHVGEEHEPIVRRSFGHLDRQEVAERDAQQLGLSAGDLPVELGVAEQRRARAVLVHLGRLALGMQVVAAHPAVAAGDVERDHDPVADASAAVTSGPTSSTMPIGSCPSTSPASRNGASTV